MFSYLSSAFSYLFSYFGNPVLSSASDYYDETVKYLREFQNVTPESKEASLRYLNKKETKDRYMVIISSFTDPVKLTAGMRNTLGITYVEMKIDTKSEGSYMINFWPCMTCACIGVQKIETGQV
jgi:hypothetical protein